MVDLRKFAEIKLARLREQTLFREVLNSDRRPGARIVRNGRELVSFCCNDYLGLSQHPAVRKAAKRVIDRYGVGAGASRLVTGNHSLYRALEDRLAAIKGTPAACVMGSGYLVNTGVIPCFVGPDDLIIIDELCHACLYAGSALSKSTVIPFGHNDMGHLHDLLCEHRPRHRHCLIITEGVFSMDGDLAPLDEMTDLAESFDAWLLSDDAHGFGVIGERGRGSTFAHQGRVNVHLQTGTLSKAVGAYGGYVCAATAVIELIRNRARTLVYSTGLPPAIVAASLAAIEIIEGDAALRDAPLRKARLFARESGLPEPRSPIVPLVTGSASAALKMSQALEDRGFLITAIRPPTVPAGTARLRVTFSAAHRDEDVVALAGALRDLGCPGLPGGRPQQSVA